jgi:predicted ATPase
MKLDNNQIKIKLKLDELLNIINKPKRKIYSIFKTDSRNIANSLYIYGGVGRGKTKLMKDFFDSCETSQKFYIHFNNFIRQIHQELFNIRLQKTSTKNELFIALSKVLKNNSADKMPKIICFDEFQVSDIADAMILSQIFKIIFDKEIIVIFTSNSHPLELYKNGLQRELFIDFIENILLTKTTVLHLDSAIDYRELKIKNSFKKYLEESVENNKIFLEYFLEFTKNKIN